MSKTAAVQEGGTVATQEPVLCYVDGAWAYFTTQPLAEQWGDDWNDAPYECNAGTPYDPCWHRRLESRKPGEPLCSCKSCERDWDGERPRWEITRVAWDGPFAEPKDGHFNSPWTVDGINRGDTPWLSPDKYGKQHGVRIMAGTTLAEFIRAVQSAGGTVYLPALTPASQSPDSGSLP